MIAQKFISNMTADHCIVQPCMVKLRHRGLTQAHIQWFVGTNTNAISLSFLRFLCEHTGTFRIDW